MTPLGASSSVATIVFGNSNIVYEEVRYLFRKALGGNGMISTREHAVLQALGKQTLHHTESQALRSLNSGTTAKPWFETAVMQSLDPTHFIIH